MKNIFIHGGPGLNSHPERHLLKLANGRETFFWDEPSSKRDQNYIPDRAYQNWLTSLLRFIERQSENTKVTLVAHSFGAFAINDLLPKIHHRVERLILIAPIFNLLSLDKNILDLAINLKVKKADLAGIEDLIAAKLGIGENFNSSRFSALLKALGDDEVLPAYWSNHAAAAVYNQYFMDDAYGIDFNSFKNVRDSIPHNVSHNEWSGDVLICCGALDPVAKLEQDFYLIQNLYPNSRIKMAPNSGHYPHIEEPELFRNWISSEELSSNKSLHSI